MSGPQSQEAVVVEKANGVQMPLEGPISPLQSSAEAPGSSPTSSSQTPVQSILDVDAPPSARNASISGSSPRGITFANPPVPVRTVLELTSPPPTRTTHSALASPVELHPKIQMTTTVTKHRSQSDTSQRPANFGPRSGQQLSSGGFYKFSSFLSNTPAVPLMPKRNSQTGKRLSGAMASVMSGDLSALLGRGDRGRKNSVSSTASSNHSKSRSPHNRFLIRSSSPSLRKDKLELESSEVIDKTDANRRLLDANHAAAGGPLSGLGGKGEKNQRRGTNTGDDPTLMRLPKSPVTVHGAEVPAAESSDEENYSSDDEGPRGRGKERGSRGGSPEPAEKTEKATEVDRERPKVTTQQVHLASEPEITVTSPGGNRPKPSRPVIHPDTSFDDVQSNSGFNTPVDSDAEENMTDIKRAQKLAINMTDIISTPATKRCVRTLYRGDFPKMQEEAEEDIRRVRKYLVAMDLSSESLHALEWTVGTVLRDGDTLLAIYCVDEQRDDASIKEDDAQMKAQVAAVATQASRTSTPIMAASVGPTIAHCLPKLDSPSTSASPAGREHAKMEHERMRYVQHITDRVSMLLRKTKLQVKVVIEVIHCKSSRHLITEVIDYLQPTLVILGCRGRSHLQGVLLGSFSNYLVTKSSVPVMVARKKLKKHAKIKRPKIRLTNNLASPAKSLIEARID